MSTDYVPMANAACRAGCQLSQALSIARATENIISGLGRNSMSQALWCDQGGHAFSERDPGRQRISVDVLNEDTEEIESETRDLCGECAREAGLLSPRKTRSPKGSIGNG